MATVIINILWHAVTLLVLAATAVCIAVSLTIEATLRAVQAVRVRKLARVFSDSEPVVGSLDQPSPVRDAIDIEIEQLIDSAPLVVDESVRADSLDVLAELDPVAARDLARSIELDRIERDRIEHNKILDRVERINSMMEGQPAPTFAPLISSEQARIAAEQPSGFPPWALPLLAAAFAGWAVVAVAFVWWADTHLDDPVPVSIIAEPTSSPSPAG